MAPGPTDPQGGRRTFPDRAVVEAHLRMVRPECDQPESPDDDAEIRIGRSLKYPKDKGYGKFLETPGYDRNRAGMMAAMIVEEGRVRAATAKRNAEFAQALRRLGNSRLETEAFLANAKVALEALNGTVLTRGLFDGLPRFDGLVSALVPIAQMGALIPPSKRRIDRDISSRRQVDCGSSPGVRVNRSQPGEGTTSVDFH